MCYVDESLLWQYVTKFSIFAAVRGITSIEKSFKNASKFRLTSEAIFDEGCKIDMVAHLGAIPNHRWQLGILSFLGRKLHQDEPLLFTTSSASPSTSIGSVLRHSAK